MADGSWILKYLVIIATFERLVAEEMDVSVVYTTRRVLLILDVLQAVCLVPASWEHVERDLAADRVAGSR